VRPGPYPLNDISGGLQEDCRGTLTESAREFQTGVRTVSCDELGDEPDVPGVGEH